jgi:sugar lactone lactonase YvrE
LAAAAQLTIIDPNACIPAGSNAVIPTPATTSVGPLYVTNQDGHRVNAYAAGAVGDAIPVLNLEGPATQMSTPRGIGRDAAGFLYVANQTSNAITVYAPGADGNTAPVRVISGPNTQINVPEGPEGLAVDGAGSVYVANQADHKILVFAAGASGDVAPSRRIAGSCTGVSRPMGLALDTSGRLYVANLASYNSPGSQRVTVYDAGANGNAEPRTTISGGATWLFNPLGIAVDPSGYIYVANYGNTDQGPSNSGTTVTVYSPGASGNAAPARMIIGTMAEPTGLALDANGALHVANFPFDFLVVYPAGADGLATPLSVISGPNTRLMRPAYVTF